MRLFKKASSHTADGVTLLLQVPRTNEKKELAAEQLFASVHGLLTASYGSSKHARERLSLEIAVKQKQIGFYIWVPTELESFVEEQIYAQYPTLHITKVEDYALFPDSPGQAQLVAELKLTKNDVLPIKTFPSFEVDPLAAITATLAKFETNEEAWIQVLIQPATDGWYKKTERYLAGKKTGSVSQGVIGALWKPPETTKGDAPTISEYERAQMTGAQEKSQKLAYEVAVRIFYRGMTSPGHARMRLQAMVASFKQFNTTYLNGFAEKYVSHDPKIMQLYAERRYRGPGFTMNIEEIASLYHLPHTSVETPNILWANTATAEPPATLPLVEGNEYQENLSPIAVTNFRGHNTMFGLLREDRSRHLYIIGQTGTGKSGMLELLTISDIYSPFGFAVIDPHGDYAINILKRIPMERAKDVIYFNPADTEFPIAFNPLEVSDPKLRTHTVSELIGVLKRMFESWGPRLEYILRYTLLALIEYPEATMLDITRMLTDKKFRAEVVAMVDDPVVVNFWNVEFASWNEKFATEAVAPVLNKVGAFTANPIVRNIIGQPKSSFNVRKIMDERKILIVNLSRGLIGEDNAALLGALLVTKIQMAAMSRADIDGDKRIPFYLYVDEFQNFATDSFATILSEARKYALNLTVANQYTAQMMDTVKDAVFGNVGSILSFRTSADDARTMLKYFEPKFTEFDIVHMHNRNFILSMTIDGEKVQAFSAFSLNLPQSVTDFSEEIIANSRANYAIGRSEVDAFVQDRYLSPAQLAHTVDRNMHKGYDRGGRPAPSPPNHPRVVQAAPAAPGGPTPIVPRTVISPAVEVNPVAAPSEPGVRPKRKRTRKRKNKTGEGAAPAHSPQQAPQIVQPQALAPVPVAPPTPVQPAPVALPGSHTSTNDETTIRLR
jgi:hypothetical protein